VFKRRYPKDHRSSSAVRGIANERNSSGELPRLRIVTDANHLQVYLTHDFSSHSVNEAITKMIKQDCGVSPNLLLMRAPSLSGGFQILVSNLADSLNTYNGRIVSPISLPR
jgi:hypothetical protein